MPAQARRTRDGDRPGRGANVILLVDNYDSFTYNLAHLFGALGAEVAVHRNDAITPDEAAALEPSHLVVSPGPGRPEHAGASVRPRLALSTPTLGVCPGHQAIVTCFGGRSVTRTSSSTESDDRSPRRQQPLRRDPDGVRGGSLPLARRDGAAGLPRCDSPRIRRRGDGRRHRELPVYVQFHPSRCSRRAAPTSPELRRGSGPMIESAPPRSCWTEPTSRVLNREA
jgi:anthranilate/para-aminobenzoate synthase component II